MIVFIQNISNAIKKLKLKTAFSSSTTSRSTSPNMISNQSIASPCPLPLSF